MKNEYALKVLILPDAGSGNPFQFQMIAFLRNQGFEVFVGERKRLGSIYKTVNRFNPDIIYFDWVHSYLIGKTFLWTIMKSICFVFEIFYIHFFKKIPIIHTLHNTQNHGRYWLFWERIIYGFFLRKCSKIRVYSEATRKEVIETFRVSKFAIRIIQDIPYHHYYNNNTSKSESRAHFSIPQNSFVFLFFGRIREYKGLEHLIHAFKATKRSDGEHLLIIAGKCLNEDYLKSLKQLSRNCSEIIWHDRFIPENEVQFFFNAADVVVLPFTKIDHSGSIDLAMSFRKPIITLKTGAASALLDHQKSLLFCNHNELASRMALAHEMKLDEIGMKNFEKANAANYQELSAMFEIE